TVPLLPPSLLFSDTSTTYIYSLSLHDALPIFFKFYHLLGQILIALGHLAIRVMGKNAFALGADLLCPDRMGNLGAEDLDFAAIRSEEHTSELQSRFDLVCRLLLEKKNKTKEQ